MTVLSKNLESNRKRKHLFQLLLQLRQIIKEIVDTCSFYIQRFIRRIVKCDKIGLSRVSSVYELWGIFIKILKKLFRVCKTIIKRLYWLLAPDVMMRLGIRHAILFGILFITPSILRSFGNPCYYQLNQLFLRIQLGNERLRQYNDLNDQLNNASSYDEFCEIGSKLDEIDGSYEWKTTQSSSLYNYQRINQDILFLNKIIQTCRVYQERHKNNNDSNNSNNNNNKKNATKGGGIDSTQPTHPVRDLMEFLRSRAIRNYCGITNPELYDKARVGTKEIIGIFRNQVCDAFEYIANCNDPEITTAEKLVYFNECRHVLGRSALCMSGGASLGAYHVGVVYQLSLCNLLPKVITGSSVGSLIASLICTKTDKEFEECIHTPGMLNLTFFEKKKPVGNLGKTLFRLRRLWKTGNLLDVTVLRDTVRANIGDITFLEAFQKTGRILNVTVTGTDSNTVPRLLNFLTAPNVVIWSAVIASCAIPFVFAPQQLQVKETTLDENNEKVTTIHPIFLPGVTFADGSIAHDLPMTQLQQLFNVDNFIVSQVNPHLVPFLFHSIKAPIPLFERLFHFLGSEFHLYLSSLVVNCRELGILRGLYYVNALIAQRYTGDVTIVPDVKTSDFLRLLSNPTHEYIQECAKISQRSTWKHVCRLEALCSVEVCIEECLHQLRARALYLQQQTSLMSRSNLHQSQSQLVLSRSIDSRSNNSKSNININISNQNENQARGSAPRHKNDKKSKNNNNNNNDDDDNDNENESKQYHQHQHQHHRHGNNLRMSKTEEMRNSKRMKNGQNKNNESDSHSHSKTLGRVSSFQTPNIDSFIAMTQKNEHETSPWLNDVQSQNRLHIPQTVLPVLQSLSQKNLLLPSHDSGTNLSINYENENDDDNEHNNDENLNEGVIVDDDDNDNNVRICHLNKRGSIQITQISPSNEESINTPASIENELNIPRTMSLNELLSSDLGDIA